MLNLYDEYRLKGGEMSMARYYYDDAIEERRDRRSNNAWLPLLIIPLLLLSGYIGYGMASQYDASQNTTQQYGVGGAPPELVSPTVAPSLSPSPTVTPEPTEDVTPTRMQVPEVEGEL